MRRRIVVLIAVVDAIILAGVVFWFLQRPAQAQPLPSSTPAAKVAASASNAFGLELFQKLRSRQGNFLISPYSIHTALSMSREGAGGVTADQLTKALHLDKVTREGLRDLPARLQAPGYHGFELSTANRLWVDSKFPIKATYTAALKDVFGADMASLDFSNPAAATQINEWTRDATKKRIPQIVTPADLAPPVSVVLTNALYFKGNWDKPFKRSATKEDNFHIAPGQTRRAMLMSQTEKHLFADFDKSEAAPAFRALSMNYTGGDLAMLLLLPELGELEKLEAALTPELLSDITAKMNETRLPVTLPRFRFEHHFSLVEPLQDLGITHAFDAKAADFSNISPSLLFIKDVLHRAFIELNEDGTEAAAATVVMKTASAVPHHNRPPEFRADHPFLLILRDRESGVVLFLGRVANPN